MRMRRGALRVIGVTKVPVVITIKSRGLTELARRMHEAPNTVQALISLALMKSADSVHKKLRTYTQAYPRKRASSYVRTFALRGSSRARMRGQNTAIVTIGEGLDYAGKVMGYDTQMEMHKHMGWWTNKGVAEDMRGVIGKHFMSSAKELARYIGSG